MLKTGKTVATVFASMSAVMAYSGANLASADSGTTGPQTVSDLTPSQIETVKNNVKTLKRMAGLLKTIKLAGSCATLYENGRPLPNGEDSSTVALYWESVSYVAMEKIETSKSDMELSQAMATAVEAGQFARKRGGSNAARLSNKCVSMVQATCKTNKDGWDDVFPDLCSPSLMRQ